MINGIKFKMKKVSKLLILDASKRILIPKPPKVYIEEKQRTEENPNDPDYVEALAEANYNKAMVVVNAYVALGTKPIEVPEDIEPLASDSWIEAIKELGVDEPKSERARYLYWCKYISLGDEGINELVTAVMRFSGVTLETDVKQAADSFRGNETGNTDSGVRDTA